MNPRPALGALKQLPVPHSSSLHPVHDGDVELFLQGVHIDPDKTPLLLRNPLTCLNGVVQQVSQEYAQLRIRDPHLRRHMGCHLCPDLVFAHQGQLAVQDRIRHEISCLYDLVDLIEALVKLFEIHRQFLIFSQFQVRACRLDVVVVIMAPCPHGAVHRFHFLIMTVYQIALEAFRPPVDQAGNPHKSRCKP